MEYQKTINLLGDTSNQPSTFRTKNWVEINDDLWETHKNNKIKFKTSMMRSNLYDYWDAYIHFKGTITGTNKAGEDATVNNTNKKVIFKKLCSIY